MAIHVRSLSQLRKITRLNRQQRIRSAIASLTLVLVCLIIFSQLTIFILNEPEAQFIAYVPTEDAPPKERTKQDQALSNAVEAASRTAPRPEVIPIIANTTMADVSMVAPDYTAPESMSVSGMGIELGSGFGIGEIGDGLGLHGTGEGASGLGSTDGGGSTLEGTLYDLKRLRSGADSEFATGAGNEGVVNLLSNFYMRSWNRASLDKYSKAPTKLYTSNFYLPNCKDDEAPYAYKTSETMKGSRWVALYKGQVMAPKSGKFRFLAIGDSILAIRFNRRNVLQCGFHSLTAQHKWNTRRKEVYDSGKDVALYKGTEYWTDLFCWNNIHFDISRPEDMLAPMEGDVQRSKCCGGTNITKKEVRKIPVYEPGPLDPGAERKILRYEEKEVTVTIKQGGTCSTYTEHVNGNQPMLDSLYCLRFDLMNPNNLPGGFEPGEEFQVQANQWYDFELMISEIGGGNFGFCVLIEDVTDPVDMRDADNQRVYQLFRTSFIEPDPEKFYQNIHFPVNEDEKTYPPYAKDSMIWPARHKS